MTNPDRDELVKLADFWERKAEFDRKMLHPSDRTKADDYVEETAKLLRRLASSDGGVKGEPEPVAWRWRGVHSNGPYTFSEVRPEHHPDYATEPLYLGPVSVEDAIRNTFAEITSKAIAVSDPTSDDPERVRHYIVPVGPMHRAAGNIGYQMFDGDRLLAAASADALKYHAALVAIRDQTQHSYDFPVQSDDAFDLAVDNVIRMVHETVLKALADHITAPPADAGMREALANLLAYTERNECTHGSTSRGGSIWTICDDCGRKWADDRGGFKPYVEPAEITAARAALTAPGATTKSDGGLTPNATTIAAIEELDRGGGEIGSGYSEYTPVTVRGSTSDPSSTRSAVTVEEIAREIWLAGFRRAFSKEPTDPWENQGDRSKATHLNTARALLDQFEIRRK